MYFKYQLKAYAVNLDKKYFTWVNTNTTPPCYTASNFFYQAAVTIIVKKDGLKGLEIFYKKTTLQS